VGDMKTLKIWEIHRTTAKGDVIYTIEAEDVRINADVAWAHSAASCPTGVRFYTGDQLVASFPDYDMVRSLGEPVTPERDPNGAATLRPWPFVPWQYYLDPDDAKIFEHAVRDANRLGGPFPMEKLVIRMANMLDMYHGELNNAAQPS